MLKRALTLFYFPLIEKVSISGDAVNVASRMDTTGVPGRIQLRAECVSIFQDIYDFEPRGKVYVKGKDMMEVVLLKGKKQEPLEEF